MGQGTLHNQFTDRAKLYKYPAYIDFLHNGLGFKVFCRNYKKKDGQRASVFIEVNDAWNNDLFYITNYKKHENIVVECAENPNVTKNEVPKGLDNSTDIINELQKINEIANLYIFEYHSDSRFTIKAREYAEFEWDYNLHLPGSWNLLNSNNGEKPEYEKDYSLEMRVELNNTILAELEYYPDDDSIIQMRIASILEPFVNYSLPELQTPFPTESEILEYTAYFSEKYKVFDENSAMDILRTNNALVFKGMVLPGKIDFETYPDFNLIDTIKSKRLFLNTLQNLELWETAYSFLHFINPNNFDQTLKVNAKLYKSDNSVINIEIGNITYNAEADKNKFYTVPATLSKMGLSQEETAEVFKYEIAVLNSNQDYVIYPTTFYITEKPQYAVEFVFINKYGFYEYLNCSAKITKNLKTEKRIFEKDTDVDYKPSDGEIFAVSDSALNSFTAELNSVYKKDAEALQNALIADKFYEIKNRQYINCIMNAGSFTIIKESEDLANIKFQYQRAFYK